MWQWHSFDQIKSSETITSCLTEIIYDKDQSTMETKETGKQF